MITRCLICNSSVVLSKDAAKALARLMGTLDGFLRGIQQSPARQQPITSDLHCDSPLERAFNLMLDGICGAAANWNSTGDFIRDVRRFQFMEYDCLCLRCGAKYNEEPVPRR
ncbi:hypothetical protein AVM47_006830 [Pseudomonas aeruginosa]|uniref:hypothetical protein n=1 Tax=Pseudomonas aeruginosa TaxID=287 RepID=UPI00032E25B2|nr:hypothetical protein [Pseudomonas aeruginosa]EOQ80840.1 hypothetical protein K652_08944 [Pseudomonas aeruginosa VRFPA02]EIU3494358.1 hypothetical protein [Pseudomonas aeruginosa]KSN26254.1 hypothetical protein APA78_22195 [Pseudomonas aeruginosa]MBK1797631.1 hypothetical protein [Pseudomonas aeruginosa]HCF6759301.1 hypothetical protein [Pseudomonas aeruginosa]